MSFGQNPYQGRGSYDSVPWPRIPVYAHGSPTYTNDNDMYSAKYLPKIEREKKDYFRGSNEPALRNAQAHYWDDPDNLYGKRQFARTWTPCSYVVAAIFILFVLGIIFMK